MLRICSRCKAKKFDSHFAFKSIKTGRKQPSCKHCQNRYTKEHYIANKKKYRLNREKGRNKKKTYIANYLKKHPCVDCGEDDIIVLEFDHIRGEKKEHVSRMVCLNSLEDIIKEIDKCAVRCANCHRRKTVKRLKRK